MLRSLINLCIELASLFAHRHYSHHCRGNNVKTIYMYVRYTGTILGSKLYRRRQTVIDNRSGMCYGDAYNNFCYVYKMTVIIYRIY